MTNKIGMDGVVTRGGADFEHFMGLVYPNHWPVPVPWLDVGWGESVNREKMKGMVTGKDPLAVIPIDLDVEAYPPVMADRFQTVTSFQILEHLYNPLFHLKQIKRVLHPLGMLYLTTPDDWSWWYRLEHAFKRKYRPHFHQFCRKDLDDIFARAGLVIDSVDRIRQKTGMVAGFCSSTFFIRAYKPAPAPGIVTASSYRIEIKDLP